MKTLLIAIAVLVITPIAAQSSCAPFYNTQQGRTLVIHHLDKRENLSTIAAYTVRESTNAGINVTVDLKNKRNKFLTSARFNAMCEGGSTRLDPSSVMSSFMQQYEGMEYTITGDDIVIPSSLTVGQTLPDTAVTMVVDSGIMKITTAVSMKDRKVVRKERITVPAGTFDCYVITYTNTTKVGLSKTMYSTQWVTEGLGMVQEETRKANGNLVTKSILNTIN